MFAGNGGESRVTYFLVYCLTQLLDRPRKLEVGRRFFNDAADLDLETLRFGVLDTLRLGDLDTFRLTDFDDFLGLLDVLRDIFYK